MIKLPGCFTGLFPSIRTRRSSGDGAAESARNVGDVSHFERDSKAKLDVDKDLSECMRYASCCDFGSSACTGMMDWSTPALPPYTELKKDDVYRPEVMKTIEDTLDKLDPELRKLSLQIHDHPEIMFQEKYAHDTLTAFMSSHGFNVTKHYLGLETAWRATYTVSSSSGKSGSKHRVFGVNSEMDALPDIGHACGHNLIAISGVGVALALKTALEQHGVDGTIVLLGTPAEEGGGGKAILIERGGYKDMDACLMCHPGPGQAHSFGQGSSLAVRSIEIEFFGHSSHASAAPWEGTNALDAAFLAYSSISVLRQQIKPTHRVHGVLKGKDLAANVIPDYTKMLWYVRAPTATELDVLRDRVKACFEAAALATGCSLKLEVGRMQNDLRQNKVLARGFGDIISKRYGWLETDAEGAIGGSTDFGNVTYELPAIHPSYAIPTQPNGGNHTPGFTASARTKEAHEACLTMTKALALTAFRVIDDDDFFQEVKRAFQEGKKQ